LNENEDSKTLSDRQNARISGDVGLAVVFYSSIQLSLLKSSAVGLYLLF